MAKVGIVYHSGFGHTAKVAEYIMKGAISVPEIRASRYKAEDFASPNEGPWGELDAADAIIFGAPTYMGSASAPMKQFMDASSNAWFTGQWSNKIAAGFTNSASLAGDKNVTLQQFSTFAAQHNMIWVPAGMKSGYISSDHEWQTAHNRTGHYLGLGTQSMSDQPAEETPDAAELETAELFGKRVAEATLRWVRGA